MTKFIYPTPEQRLQILKENNEPCDRRILENECAVRSGLPRSRRWRLEKEERFPKRSPLGRKSNSWLLSDVLFWVNNPPSVNDVANPYKRTLNKKQSTQQE